MKLSVEILLHN